MAGKLDLSAVEEMSLRVLSRCELYGLEILRAVRDATNGKRKIGHNSLYPALHQLEKMGMVESRWGEHLPGERAGARRKYYKITARGQSAVREADQIQSGLAQWKPGK